jgi:metal-dependent amidase/aminoacylase/carboxypeptidase family protein
MTGISPYGAAKEITDCLLSKNNSDITSDDYLITTLVELHIGEEAYGIAAGDGVVRMTVRAGTDLQLQSFIRNAEDVIRQMVAKTEGLQYSVRWLEYFAATDNTPEAVALVRKAAAENGLPYIAKEVPFSWGEDFGFLTQQYPGALFGLGAGTDCPPLHHQNYDFPNDIIEAGVRMFYAVAEEILR